VICKLWRYAIDDGIEVYPEKKRSIGEKVFCRYRSVSRVYCVY
jgi:hypothetical protein